MRRLTALVGAITGLLLLSAPAAHAASVSGGCTGSLRSFDADGAPLSQVVAPGRGGTSKDPLVVDPDGTVTYDGATAVAFHDHTWSVDVMGFTVKSGGSANERDESTATGEVDVGDYLPGSVVGLFKAGGTVSATEGTCTGSLWVKVDGSPVGTIPWLVGVGAAAGGAVAMAAPATAGVRGLLMRRGA